MKLRISLWILVGAAISVQAGCSRSAPAYVAAGNKFFESGKYEDATIQYRKALQKDPNFGEAYYRIGLAAMQENKTFQAYEPMFRAVELMPANDAAKTRLADLSLALYLADPNRSKRWYDQIDKLADQLLAKNQNSFDGLRLKGSLRLLDRNPKEAIVLFEKANQIEPMRPDLIEGYVQALFQDNRVAEGERLAWQLIGKYKTFGAIYDVLYRQFISAGRTADAENLLKTKVANNPQQADYLLQLARHYALAKNFAEMNRTLQRMVDNQKDFPRARLQVGEFYASIRQWEPALQQFQEGVRSSSQDKLDYQKQITDVLLAQGKKDEASRMVDEILKDHPKDEDARRIHATFLLESGAPERIAKAQAELQVLAKDQPRDVRLKLLLGRIYLAQRNVNAARNEFREAIVIRNDEPSARLALASISLSERKPDEAIRYTGEILARDPENGPARLMRATAMIVAGYYNDARKELAHLDRQFPNSPEVQLRFGLLAIGEKKYKDAEGIFQKLYASSQNDPGAASALMEIYTAENQLERAIQWLSDGAKKSPESVPIHRLLATTAVRARKYDLAINEYHWLVAQDPKALDPRMKLGQVYQLKGNLSSAISVLQQAQQLAPQEPEVIMLLSSMLQNAGRNAEAQDGYRRVLALRPDNPFVLNNMAFLLAETGGNLDEALTMAQRALQKAPGHPVLTDTLGWVYLKKGMKDSAVQTFSMLVRQDPKNPTFHYHLGEALLAKGDKKKAKTEFESALADAPSPQDEVKLRELLGRTRG